MRLFQKISYIYKNIYIFSFIFFNTLYFGTYFRFFGFSKITKKISYTKLSKNKINTNILKVVILTRGFLKYIFFTKNCFIRSFVAVIILKKLGYKTVFKIGVSNELSFNSHSWIEVDGLPVLEENIGIYKVMKEY